MVDWSLSGSPLSVSIGDGWISGQDLGQVPVEEVWVVDEGLCVDSVIVENDGSGGSKTSAESSHDEVNDPRV